jgi:[ribosomal protein S5]-alanine N-acetyltransferase
MTSKIFIKIMRVNDVNENYVSWLNDSAVNQYLECRHKKHTIESTKEYLRHFEKGILFGIYILDNKELIGTASFGSIDYINGFAYIGIMIGNKKYWGKGIATDSILMLNDYAFNILGLHKLMAGCCVCNKASIRAFEKAGYEPSGFLKENRLINGSYVDELQYEIIKKEKSVELN